MFIHHKPNIVNRLRSANRGTGLRQSTLRARGAWLILANSIGLGLCHSPIYGQVSQQCDGKAQIINGMVVCTVTKEVNKKERDCEIESSPEAVFVFYSNPAIIGEAIEKTNKPPCAKVLNSGASQSLTGLDSEPKLIWIYGDKEGKNFLKRYITALDLPKERISLDLWAIEISSVSPAKLNDVMSEVQRQINHTREAMHLTYDHFVRLSQQTKIDYGIANRLPANFSSLFPNKLAAEIDNKGSKKLIDPRPSLSFTEMLINLNTSEKRLENYNRSALDICNWLASKKNDPRFSLFNEFEGRSLKAYDVKKIFNNDPPREYQRPFQRFMEVVLHQDYSKAKGQPFCGDGTFTIGDSASLKASESAARREEAIRKFAISYDAFRKDPRRFNSDELIRNASVIDSMMQEIADAIQLDMEDYFMRPTLQRIKEIVSRERGVDYAEVGRTNLNTLNGLESKATSTTTTSVDLPTPLRLNQLLKDAAESSKDIQSLAPGLSQVPLGTSTSALTASSGLALLSALSKEEVRWSALNSGTEITITPTVFQDRTAAELKIQLSVGNPAQDTQPDRQSKDNSLRPFSRISKSTLHTKVYIKTMDLFALGSFNNQTTVSGGRTYLPVVGTIWEGAFGDIPVVGNLFSIRRPTQNVQHQSIILTNSLIVPTAMSMASYYVETPNHLGSWAPLPTSQQIRYGRF